MKLKQYLDRINHHIKDIPDWEELEVIYATDDEGNFYEKVLFEPTLGNFNDGDFDDSGEINAICIN